MKTRISLLLAAALLAAGSCTKRPVQPRFGIAATRHARRAATESPARSNTDSRRSSTPGNPPPSRRRAGEHRLFLLRSGSLLRHGAGGRCRRHRQFADIYLADSLPTGSGNAEYEISAESEGAVVDTLVVYTITQSSYTGGAHGMYSRENYVYSLDGGYEITLADLFTEAQPGEPRPADPPETLRTIRRSGRRRARCRRVLPRIHRPDGEFPRHARKHRFLLQSV